MDDDFGFEKEQLYGFGGCFVLIIINLFGNIIISIIDFFDLLNAFSQLNGGLIAIFIAAYLNNIGLSGIIAVYIIKRRILFRKLYLIQTCISLALCFLLAFFIPLYYDRTIVQMVIAMLIRALLTVYLFRSVRVKNTFVLSSRKNENEKNMFV